MEYFKITYFHLQHTAAGKKGRGPAFLHNRGPTNESVDRQHLLQVDEMEREFTTYITSYLRL